MLMFNHHNSEKLKQLFFNPPISNFHSNYYVPKLTNIVPFFTSCSKSKWETVVLHTTTTRTPQ